MENGQGNVATVPERFLNSTYAQWQRAEGVPVHTGSFVEDLHTADVGVWPRLGQSGALVSLADQQQDDGWLIEIQPGESTEVLHHLFEASIYVVGGRGATTFWQDRSPKQTVEWQTGSLFSPPLNCFYQHFNLDGSRPARLYAATTAPMMMNILKSSEAVFDCPMVFRDRYDSSDTYFGPGHRVGFRRWQTNFVADLRNIDLDETPGRGAANRSMGLAMAGNAMGLHISDFEPGTYKKAHRHGTGAHLVVLTGTGFSLFWHEGQARTKVGWREGSLLSPREMEYHQHFNTGPVAARYVAFTFSSMVMTSLRGLTGPEVSEREGGWQIEYEDEDPEIYDLYVAECVTHGARVTLPRRSRKTPPSGTSVSAG